MVYIYIRSLKNTNFTHKFECKDYMQSNHFVTWLDVFKNQQIFIKMNLKKVCFIEVVRNIEFKCWMNI